jgi:hypothetical protein
MRYIIQSAIEKDPDSKVTEEEAAEFERVMKGRTQTISSVYGTKQVIAPTQEEEYWALYTNKNPFIRDLISSESYKRYKTLTLNQFIYLHKGFEAYQKGKQPLEEMRGTKQEVRNWIQDHVGGKDQELEDWTFSRILQPKKLIKKEDYQLLILEDETRKATFFLYLNKLKESTEMDLTEEELATYQSPLLITGSLLVPKAEATHFNYKSVVSIRKIFAESEETEIIRYSDPDYNNSLENIGESFYEFGIIQPHIFIRDLALYPKHKERYSLVLDKLEYSNDQKVYTRFKLRKSEIWEKGEKGEAISVPYIRISSQLLIGSTDLVRVDGMIYCVVLMSQEHNSTYDNFDFKFILKKPNEEEDDIELSVHEKNPNEYWLFRKATSYTPFNRSSEKGKSGVNEIKKVAKIEFIPQDTPNRSYEIFPHLDPEMSLNMEGPNVNLTWRKYDRKLIKKDLNWSRKEQALMTRDNFLDMGEKMVGENNPRVFRLTVWDSLDRLGYKLDYMIEVNKQKRVSIGKFQNEKLKELWLFTSFG